MTTYKCAKCGQRKPRTTEYFWRDKRNLDGLRSCCIECGSKEQKARAERDKERNNELKRRWRDSNLEKYRESQRRYIVKRRQREKDLREADKQAQLRAARLRNIYKGVDV